MQQRRAADRAAVAEHGCADPEGLVDWALSLKAGNTETVRSKEAAAQAGHHKKLVQRWRRDECVAALEAAATEKRAAASAAQQQAQQARAALDTSRAAVEQAAAARGTAAAEQQEAVSKAAATALQAELAAAAAEQEAAALTDCTSKQKPLLKDMRAALKGIVPLSASVLNAAVQAQASNLSSNKSSTSSRAARNGSVARAGAGGRPDTAVLRSQHNRENSSSGAAAGSESHPHGCRTNWTLMMLRVRLSWRLTVAARELKVTAAAV